MEDINSFLPTNENIEYIGRFLKEESGVVSFSWSSCKIGFDTNSTQIYLEFESIEESIFYNVFINGEKVTEFEVEKGKHVVQLDLEGDTKRRSILIERRNELFAGVAKFHKLYLNDGELLSYSNLKERYIEFIGDSLTCGYGIFSKGATDPFLHITEDSSEAHAATAAKILDSDYSIVAYSGKGVFRDYAMSQVEPMGFFYPLVNRWPKTEWDFNGRKPDLIVINLGSNDFGQGIPPKEEFINTYVEFIKEINRLNKGAKFLLVCGHVENNRDLNISYIKEVFNKASEKDLGISLFVMPYIDQTLPQGADAHPGLKQQKIAGEFLSKDIQRVMGW